MYKLRSSHQYRRSHQKKWKTNMKIEEILLLLGERMSESNALSSAYLVTDGLAWKLATTSYVKKNNNSWKCEEI